MDKLYEKRPAVGPRS